MYVQFLDPYTFPSTHERLLEPYNYFQFGQRYVGTLIDFDNSFLGHADIWAKVGSVRVCGWWGGRMSGGDLGGGGVSACMFCV